MRRFLEVGRGVIGGVKREEDVSRFHLGTEEEGWLREAQLNRSSRETKLTEHSPPFCFQLSRFILPVMYGCKLHALFSQLLPVPVLIFPRLLSQPSNSAKPPSPLVPSSSPSSPVAPVTEPEHVSSPED